MVFIAFGRVMQFLLMLAMMRFATTFLSPEEMGRTSLVLTTTAFFALFLVNPVGMFINRRMHAWFSSGVIQHYAVHYLVYLIGVALLAALILTFISLVGFLDLGASIGWLLLLVCGSLVFNTINQTSIPSLNLLGYRKSFILLTLLTVFSSFSVGVFFVIFLSPSSVSWLSGLLIGQFCIGAIGTGVLYSRLPSQEEPKEVVHVKRQQIQNLFNFAWPISIAAGLWWMQSQGYRYLVERALGASELGLFVAGFSVSVGIIAGFESILTAYFQPKLYKGMHSKDPSSQIIAWKLYANSVIPALLLTAVYIILVAPQLATLFLGREFQLASKYIFWGALAETARSIITTFSLVANMKMKTRSLILPNLVGAIFSILLCLILIPLFDINGAGIALVFSGASIVALMYLVIIRSVVGPFFIENITQLSFYIIFLIGTSKILIYLLTPMDITNNFIYFLLLGLIYIVLIYKILKKYIYL